MRLEAKKYLYDMQQAAALLSEFTAGKDFAAYVSDAMLRAAVEREFEIIGEALGQLAKLDEELAAGISERRAIVATPRPAIGPCSPMRSSDCWTSPPSTFDRGGRTRPMITNVWCRLARLPTTR